ncbi:MAG: DUF503 domain-containing protein [bacterium]|nr:DUF503 domain-containing protein [bacterium]
MVVWWSEKYQTTGYQITRYQTPNMVVGICRIKLHLPASNSLKAKRQAIRPIIERVKKFNISIAEVDSNDFWQTATLGLANISTDAAHIHRIFNHVISVIEANHGDVQLVDYEIEML